jgi:hypothetical protein
MHKVVYLHELPFVIEEQAKLGYDRYMIVVFDTRKPRRERVEVRFWRYKAMPRKFPCPSCGQLFSNPTGRDLHAKKTHTPVILEAPA